MDKDRIAGSAKDFAGKVESTVGDMAGDAKTQAEITSAFDRLVNKLLHPPLESLRDEAEQGPPHGLLEALKRLFRLNE